ncbi:hypothetical protein B0H11DRAFT_1932727 [Mycena galericulata]|nr:hypothetical protein B0H11DRAFT_1932727 [Mycena galericulata]
MPPSQIDGPNTGLTNYEFMCETFLSVNDDFNLPHLLRQRKIAEQREKTRHRMTQYRLRLKSAPLEAQEATRQRAREARARYRQKNRLQLMTAARCKRIDDFELTHGTLAADAKAERRLDRQRLRSERTRRKGRLLAAGKVKSRKRAAPVESSSSEDDQSDEDRATPSPPVASRKRALSTSTSKRVPPTASLDEDTSFAHPPSSASARGPPKSSQVAAPMESSDEETVERRAYIERLKAQRRIRLLGRPHPESR